MAVKTGKERWDKSNLKKHMEVVSKRVAKWPDWKKEPIMEINSSSNNGSARNFKQKQNT